LKNTTTSEIKRIPFTKAARDTGEYGLKRLERIMKKLKQIDDNLPHKEGAQVREERRCRKRSLQLWDYQRENLCTPGRNWDAVCEKQWQTRFRTQKVYQLEEQIYRYFDQEELSKFPQEYLGVYTGQPKPTTTTCRPFIKGEKWDDKDEITYLDRKITKLMDILKPIWKEEMEMKANGTTELPEYYIRHRAKRFA
jgi:hypothetical protein